MIEKRCGAITRVALACLAVCLGCGDAGPDDGISAVDVVGGAHR